VLKVTPHVATQGAESAVYDCLVYDCDVQNNDVELLAGYLSLHQDGDQLSVKWTPNQLMNGCSEDADESLPTKKYTNALIFSLMLSVALIIGSRFSLLTKLQ